MTHNGANTLGSLRPSLVAISILSADSWALVVSVSPESTQIRSPAWAFVAFAHAAKSSWS